MALTPRDEAELADCIGSARGPLLVEGSGSKSIVGRPVYGETLQVGALSGIVDYRPEELVITARAGTPLEQIESTLAASRQRLAFEPPDWRALLGLQTPAATIGGVLGANAAGSRRLAAGGARDHFLGLRAVDGRGVAFKAGGRVVKNVTGFDLPKLIAGSWGTLAVLTEVSLRAVPMVETECTVGVGVDDPQAAVVLMTTLLGGAHEITSAACDPERGAVLLRLEGFRASVHARLAALAPSLGGGAAGVLATDDRSRALWQQLGAGGTVGGSRVVWRVCVPPSEAPRVIAALAPRRWLMDWGGALLWLGFDAFEATRVRSAAASGHATLMKASVGERASVSAFPPPAPALAALAARLKAAFDPDGRLNPGRMD